MKANGKDVVDVSMDSNYKNDNKKGKKHMKSNKHLITLDDINGMICPDCNETAEVVNCKENGMAMFNHGQMQLKVKNYMEAYRLFEKGADLGDACCQHNLAVLLKNGHGCKKNYLKAVTLLNESYWGGNPDALFTLGWMYFDGSGVKQDYDKSYEMHSRAAEEGSQMAKELFEKIKMKEGKMKTELPRLEVIDEDCENEAMEDLWGRITQDFIVGKMSVDELHNKYFDEFLSHRQWEIEDEFSDIIKNLTKKN